MSEANSISLNQKYLSAELGRSESEKKQCKYTVTSYSTELRKVSTEFHKEIIED